MKYFDYASSSPMHDSVIEAMKPYLQENFGNPHSRSHEFGWKAEEAVEKARAQIAALINAQADEIIFTSGATESNNLALKGYALGPNADSSKKKIIATVTEHKCVIETLRYLKKIGFDVEFLRVDTTGLINLDELAEKLDGALMCTISVINNETGAMHDMDAISKLCRERKVVLHTDAAQSFGKIPLNARQFDMISISGHKIYGPKGIGVLFVSKTPRIRIAPLIHGGGQERGMRSGTLPTALCVGLGQAALVAQENMQQNFSKVQKMHDKIYNELIVNGGIPEIYLNGAIEHKSPYIINISIPYVEGESMMMRMNQFALASGSACTSKSLEPSYVIKAMHPENSDLAQSSIRVSLSDMVEESDVDELIDAFKKNIKELRDLSPLWDMVQNGVDLKSIKWNAH